MLWGRLFKREPAKPTYRRKSRRQGIVIQTPHHKKHIRIHAWQKNWLRVDCQVVTLACASGFLKSLRFFWYSLNLLLKLSTVLCILLKVFYFQSWFLGHKETKLTTATVRNYATLSVVHNVHRWVKTRNRRQSQSFRKPESTVSRKHWPWSREAKKAIDEEETGEKNISIGCGVSILDVIFYFTWGFGC